MIKCFDFRCLTAQTLKFTRTERQTTNITSECSTSTDWSVFDIMNSWRLMERCKLVLTLVAVCRLSRPFSITLTRATAGRFASQALMKYDVGKTRINHSRRSIRDSQFASPNAKFSIHNPSNLRSAEAARCICTSKVPSRYETMEFSTINSQDCMQIGYC